jgi:hypothetical protein
MGLVWALPITPGGRVAAGRKKRREIMASIKPIRDTKKEIGTALVIAVLSVALAISAPAAAFADAPGGGMARSDEQRVTPEAYEPDEAAAKYVKELIDAGLLTSAVYDQPFYDSLTRAELVKYVMAFYTFLGGADPGDPGDNFVDTDDPDAEKAYALGLLDFVFDFDPDDGRKYFEPEEEVKKSAAIGVLAKAIMKVKPAEASLLPTAEAALAALRAKYRDADSIDAPDLPYVAFMDARGALLLPRDALNGGDAYFGSYYGWSREGFFLLLSDAAWVFAKARVAGFAVAPATPKALEYQSYFTSAFKNNTNLRWGESPGAYSYNVSVYITKKLKTKIRTGYASLILNGASVPTYKSVFGDLKEKKVCYLKVQAMDRHGVKSAKTLRVNFYAERFVNLNQKLFGSKTRFGFKNVKAAKKYQKTIEVKVWKLVSGKKIRAKMWLTVNKEVADDVKLIFAEIYKGKEKFPIKEMGGFQIRESKTSEHNYGTAIDINPTENCMKDGKKVVAGKFWKPGKNAYSIKPDGDVVKAFEKYGWYWGGNGWGERKDYMHFSYLHG